MTYDAVLEVARQHAPTPPPFHAVWSARDRPTQPASPRTGWIILAAAGVLTLLSMGGFALEVWSSPGVDATLVATTVGVTLLLALGMLGPLVMALLLRRRRSVVSQVLVRAAGWSMMELFVLLTFMSGPGATQMGALACLGIALFFGVALLLLGDRGLDELDSEFQPRAYRGRLLATLVLAFADAQTLVMLTAVQLSGNFPNTMIVLPGLAALAMITATWGLARLRGWGLFVNVVANLVVAALALVGALTTAFPFVVALTATAVVQVALVLPLVRTVLGGRSPDATRTSSSHRWVAIGVVALMLCGIAATVSVQQQGRALMSWSCPRADGSRAADSRSRAGMSVVDCPREEMVGW